MKLGRLSWLLRLPTTCSTEDLHTPKISGLHFCVASFTAGKVWTLGWPNSRKKCRPCDPPGFELWDTYPRPSALQKAGVYQKETSRGVSSKSLQMVKLARGCWLQLGGTRVLACFPCVHIQQFALCSLTIATSLGSTFSSRSGMRNCVLVLITKPCDHTEPGHWPLATVRSVGMGCKKGDSTASMAFRIRFACQCIIMHLAIAPARQTLFLLWLVTCCPQSRKVARSMAEHLHRNRHITVSVRSLKPEAFPREKHRQDMLNELQLILWMVGSSTSSYIMSYGYLI